MRAKLRQSMCRKDFLVENDCVSRHGLREHLIHRKGVYLYEWKCKD